jgi:hypothetical protein
MELVVVAKGTKNSGVSLMTGRPNDEYYSYR